MLYVSFPLPAGLLHARDFAFVSKLTKADTAEAEFAEDTMRTAASLAAGVGSSGELRRSLFFVN
jgi:hypothetical protein